MFKSCLLGCGPRARGHARAYEHVEKARLEAVCDKDPQRLRAFLEEFEVERAYSDLREMLEREKPDLLHVVTQPTQRVEFFELAAETGVPAMLIEKPLALDGSDFNAIAAIAPRLKTKVCVNHQLRFHPKVLELLGIVRSGEIGGLRFVEGSARLGLAGQGTHVLNLMFSFAGAHPQSVFGQVGGKDNWMGGTHRCPDFAFGEMDFGHCRGLLACGRNAPPACDKQAMHRHKRVAVFGTRGFVHWKMEAWELYTPERGYQSGEKSYGEEDVLGQAAMTDAIFEWLEDEDKPHPNRLEVSLAESNTVLGIYQSALTRRPVALPFEPEGNVLAALEPTL